MRKGFSPEEACLKTLERIAQKSKLQPHLLNDAGIPRFDLKFYAINKKGVYGAAGMHSGAEFAVHDGESSRIGEQAYLFKKK